MALSLDKVQLFEGDRTALDAVVPAAGAPQTMAVALGGKKDEIDSDAERYFRAVDRAVLDHHARPSGLPSMLAALPEHNHLFHKVRHNPLMTTGGLMIDPRGLTHDDLRQRTWDEIAPQFEAQQAVWSDNYAVAVAKGLGGEDRSQVAQAAVAGRVATLLIEAERQVARRIDGTTGRIDPADLDTPRMDDVLKDLGARVESMGGEVHVLSVRRMPSPTGVEASFRH